MIFVGDLLVDFLNTEKDVYMLPFIHIIKLSLTHTQLLFI